MSRKPMNRLNGLDSREAIWKAIRELRTFTVRTLREETILKLDTVRDYVTGLANAGYLAEMETSKNNERTIFIARVWELVRDVGVDAPRVRKDGTQVVQGQGRKQMWNTMHILKSFTASSLAVAASVEGCIVKESTAADYVRHLHFAGYLIKMRGSSFRLARQMYTGPKPPMIQRTKRVWDQNLKKVMWRSDD